MFVMTERLLAPFRKNLHSYSYSLAPRDANITERVLHYPTNYHSEDITLTHSVWPPFKL